MFGFQRALLRASRSHIQGGPGRIAKITFHIPPSRPGHKRKTRTTVEPLRGSNVPGNKAAIHHILARFGPKRIEHDRRSTRAEEFLVRREPQTSTFGDALEQCRLGFEVVSVTSLEENMPSDSLQPFV